MWAKKRNYVLILLLIIVCSTAVFLFFGHHSESSPEVKPSTEENMPIDSTPLEPEEIDQTPAQEGSGGAEPVVPVPVVGLREVMAWIYPGTPACDAKKEYADGRKIHVLKAEYFRIAEGGTLDFLTEADSGCNGYSPANIQSLKSYSNTQYVTVASAYAGDMDIFLQKAINDQEAIKTLVDFAVENDMTGVELDFEDFGGWSPEIYVRYKEFVTLLGNALHERGKKLMVDGPAISNTEEQAWFQWKYEDFVSLPVDRIVVMAYDYQFDHGSGMPVAPLTWIKNVTTWTKTKYPHPSRITIGVPAYGYRGVNGTQQFSLMTYDQIRNEPDFSSATRDQSSGEMTWKNGSNIYFYQDTQSMSQKIRVITDLGINSISVWHLGGNQWFE